MKKVRVLFVCLGNICRSPTAEGVFRHKVKQAGLADKIEMDSAGTAAYHLGNPPDSRSQRAAKKRDIDLADLTARQVSSEDFFNFDYVLAADQQNLAILKNRLAEVSHGEPPPKAKVQLFLDYLGQGRGKEIPDPYYGGAEGFEEVLDLCEQASDQLLDTIRKDIS